MMSIYRTRSLERNITDRGYRMHKNLRYEKACHASGTTCILVELDHRMGECRSLVLFRILLLKKDCKTSKEGCKGKRKGVQRVLKIK